jgi:hypothetical protein
MAKGRLSVCNVKEVQSVTTESHGVSVKSAMERDYVFIIRENGNARNVAIVTVNTGKRNITAGNVGEERSVTMEKTKESARNVGEVIYANTEK